MNEFFKQLIPQLLEYFNNDVDSIKEFIPNVLLEKLEKELKNETINE